MWRVRDIIGVAFAERSMEFNFAEMDDVENYCFLSSYDMLVTRRMLLTRVNNGPQDNCIWFRARF